MINQNQSQHFWVVVQVVCAFRRQCALTYVLTILYLNMRKNDDLHIKTSLSLSPSHQLSLFSSTHQGSAVCIHTVFLMSEKGFWSKLAGPVSDSCYQQNKALKRRLHQTWWAPESEIMDYRKSALPHQQPSKASICFPFNLLVFPTHLKVSENVWKSRWFLKKKDNGRTGVVVQLES